MSAVVNYRQRLAALQGGWDSLTLLTHFGDGGADLGNTRQAFDSLATKLVTHLSTETYKKAAQAASARAQVAIDILVRNLFERTADVGFLAADDDLKRFARETSALREMKPMQRRLAEYVAKYSVYSNVVLVSPSGEVLVQLEGGSAPAATRDALVGRTLAAGNRYVESFGASDLVPEARRALIYSQQVAEGSEVLGVLCLCFALEVECAGIFDRLLGAQDWTVLALLDEHHEVIASSDTLQLPVGVRVRPCDQTAGIMRFAGREFLAIARGAKPYQGYAGPPWRGHAMVPLQHAFESDDRAAGTSRSGVLAGARLDSKAFSADLLAVPRHAEVVQRDLSRSVWNGNVRLSTQDAANSNFARALLREVGNLGRRTQEVFERSIEDLQETVVSAVLHDSGFLASLAIEQFARNLYERANDCRWWALNDTLIGALASGSRDGAAATDVLRHINSLYTVYHGIVLFDDARRVVAVSRADLELRVGSVIDEPWAARTLVLRDSQSYSVSDFSASSFYGDRPTLVYGAALRSAGGNVIGGVAVVFDSAPQFSAMLRDILPRDGSGEPLAGCVAMFLDRHSRVIEATDMATADLVCGVLDIAATADSTAAVRVGDTCYALGTQRETGYREYAGIGARAAVLIPLGTAASAHTAARSAVPDCGRLRADVDKADLLRYTTFAVGSHWYALPTDRVIEAVDAKAVQSVAGARPCWAGVMFYGKDAVPVAELTKLLSVEPHQAPAVVILVRAPGRAQPLGLLVETLGDNCDVPNDRLLPLHATADVKSRPLVDQTIQFGNPGDALVMVLNLESIAELLYGDPRKPEADPESGPEVSLRSSVA
ncbi:MAG TPA: chemotaxis protein CheW [Steroidobacteraceae bacterium]|nr:chemotaxis protein CheW [Steroidobacteraceae bacterium]